LPIEDSSGPVLGNFSVYMPGDIENILSMERFDGMLKSVNCTDHGMSLQFNDDATFAYAQRVWDWVNGEDNHTFVMVAGNGDCGWNTQRQPFLVSSIAYDEDQNVASLRANSSDWQTVAHSYDLQIGNIPLPDGALEARDLSQDVSLDLSTSFPFNAKYTQGDLSAALECTKCGTGGSINFELKVSTKFLVPTGASIKIAPKDVSAQAHIKLTGSGALTEAKTFKKTIVSIPLNSITIPGGIVNIGPNLDVNVGFEISAFSGSTSISSGATINLSDSAILELDLLNPSNNEFSGWAPTVDTEPLKIDGKISGGVQIFAQPALKLVAEALGERRLHSLTISSADLLFRPGIPDWPQPENALCGRQI
jgi:hypothetical protein